MSTNVPNIQGSILELITSLIGKDNAPADLSERIKNKLNEELTALVGSPVSVSEQAVTNKVNLSALAREVEQLSLSVEQARDEYEMAKNNLESAVTRLGMAVSDGISSGSIDATNGFLVINENGVVGFSNN